MHWTMAQETWKNDERRGAVEADWEAVEGILFASPSTTFSEDPSSW